MERIARELERDERIAYALVFGSVARAETHSQSDLDVAVGLAAGARLSALDLGEMTGRIEAVAGKPVDLVLLDEARPALAYRVFRDGRPLFVRDRPRMVERKAQAILEYLDFKPIEDICARGALAAAARGR